MSGFAKAIIVGNLTRDPELRTTGSGFPILALSVAVNQRRKVKGEWTDAPAFFDCQVLGERGEKLAPYLAKGQSVSIAGRLEWRQWEAKDGSKRTAISINVDDISFQSIKAVERGAQSRDRAVAELGATDVTDEEVPF